MDANVRLNGKLRTILIVDDESINRELLGFLFESQYNVLYAEDGLEALEILREKHSIISIVLLDINMPRMSGKELLKIMTEDEALSQIPVIVLTSDKNSELETLQIGAMDFIKKPYDMPDIIMARVQRLIEFTEDKKIIRDVENDTLTGLYTTRFFFEYSSMLMSREPDKQFDVLVLDLEHFRMINEIYGTPFADQILRTFGGGVRSVVDDVGGIPCRSNADIFYVLIRHQEDYEEILQKLKQSLKQTGKYKSLNIRLRMGVYQCVNTNSHSLEWYVDAAKAAAKSAKLSFRVLLRYREQHTLW